MFLRIKERMRNKFRSPDLKKTSNSNSVVTQELIQDTNKKHAQQKFAENKTEMNDVLQSYKNDFAAIIQSNEQHTAIWADRLREINTTSTLDATLYNTHLTKIKDTEFSLQQGLSSAENQLLYAFETQSGIDLLFFRKYLLTLSSARDCLDSLQNNVCPIRINHDVTTTTKNDFLRNSICEPVSLILPFCTNAFKKLIHLLDICATHNTNPEALSNIRLFLFILSSESNALKNSLTDFNERMNHYYITLNKYQPVTVGNNSNITHFQQDTKNALNIGETHPEIQSQSCTRFLSPILS